MTDEKPAAQTQPPPPLHDVRLLQSFAARQRLSPDIPVIKQLRRETMLLEVPQFGPFNWRAGGKLSRMENANILRRAVAFTLPTDGEPVEHSFVCLYAALESVLTFERHGEGRYHVMPEEEFDSLARDLREWLRRHPRLERDRERRGLVYEKVRELNRLPFAHVFRTFCERHALELGDLWPVLGRPEEWPLNEIRHRLVHGDPFKNCPPPALACAREHLRWTVERMILSIFGWPVAESNVSPERLAASRREYREWREERSRFA